MICLKGNKKIIYFSMRTIKRKVCIGFGDSEHFSKRLPHRPIKYHSQLRKSWFFSHLWQRFLNAQMEFEKNKICFEYLLLEKRSFPGSFVNTFSGGCRDTPIKLGEFGKFHHIRSAPPYQCGPWGCSVLQSYSPISRNPTISAPKVGSQSLISR